MFTTASTTASPPPNLAPPHTPNQHLYHLQIMHQIGNDSAATLGQIMHQIGSSSRLILDQGGNSAANRAPNSQPFRSDFAANRPPTGRSIHLPPPGTPLPTTGRTGRVIFHDTSGCNYHPFRQIETHPPSAATDRSTAGICMKSSSDWTGECSYPPTVPGTPPPTSGWSG
ncbi:hypothetical protein DFP73DRAFT_523928 [Morchella snyderi]|nr:hypothetical protein DFP73DRAFT_523928 [Morchella snyderi]